MLYDCTTAWCHYQYLPSVSPLIGFEPAISYPGVPYSNPEPWQLLDTVFIMNMLMNILTTFPAKTCNKLFC